MKCKKVIASVLCVSVAAGFAGCKNSSKKDVAAIEQTLESYAEALQDTDPEAVLELTDWDDDDESYKDVVRAMHYDTQNDYAVKYYKEVASTITVNYESDDIDIKDGKATIKVTYEIVDWDEVMENLRENGVTKIRDAVKDVDFTKEFKGKITFVKDGNDWKITKVTNIGDVYRFIGLAGSVDPDTDPTTTDPTETDPTEPSTSTSTSTSSDIDVSESYARAVSAYLEVLKAYEPFIRGYERVYGKEYCGLYDLNSDGVPELYFLAADNVDDSYSSASFYMFTYNAYAGEAVESVKVPEIDYQAEGANFIIYITGDEMVISHGYGEEALHHIDNDIYSADLLCFATYRCDVSYEYDPENDTEKYTYEYYMGIVDSFTPIDESFYKMMLEYYINNAVSVLCSNYNPPAGDLEARLSSVKENTSYSYDAMVAYLESEQ